jgi:hypothetical protein
MTEKFEHIVEFSPAFDGRPVSMGGLKEWRTKTMRPDDGTDHTNYGVGGVEIRFVLKGEKGAIQFLIGTDWYPPHVQEEQRDKMYHIDSRFHSIQPSGWDVGYHSPVPLYEGQDNIMDDCPYLDGKPCYYDGSSLRADEWVKNILLKEGSDGIWKAMEEDYAERFGVSEVINGER